MLAQTAVRVVGIFTAGVVGTLVVPDEAKKGRRPKAWDRNASMMVTAIITGLAAASARGVSMVDSLRTLHRIPQTDIAAGHLAYGNIFKSISIEGVEGAITGALAGGAAIWLARNYSYGDTVFDQAEAWLPTYLAATVVALSTDLAATALLHLLF